MNLGPNIENSMAFSYYDDPIDQIEPLPEAGASAAVDALRLVLQEIFRGHGRNQRIVRTEVAYRRFVSLVWLLRPDLVNGCSQTELAERLGCTRAGVSKIVVGWSESLGVLGAGMKTLDARESYREVQMGHRSYHSKDGCTTVNEIGVEKITDSARAAEAKRLAAMRVQFKRGQTWRKPDRKLAWRRGLTDAHGSLTDRGKEWAG